MRRALMVLQFLSFFVAVFLGGCNDNPSTSSIAPSIKAQPASATVTAGQTSTVTAAGTAPLMYQWQKNGTAISGATAASYTTPATVEGDSGAKFTVVVSNTAGTMTSAQAALPTVTLVSIAVLLDAGDVDLGSAGPLLLPDLVDGSNITRQLAVVEGKEGILYVMNRSYMGPFDAMKNNVYQQLASNGHENFSSPAHFNNAVYIGPSGQSLQAFTITQTLLSSAPTSQSAYVFNASGAVPSVSSNGNSNGIVWALDYGGGIFIAYDATDLTKKLYDSN